MVETFLAALLLFLVGGGLVIFSLALGMMASNPTSWHADPYWPAFVWGGLGLGVWAIALVLIL